MIIICKICEKEKEANDCWCVISCHDRYYECKVNCKQYPPLKKETRLMQLIEKEIEEEIKEKPKSFFQKIIGLFSLNNKYIEYSKIKNE
jgi:hypothetical protein